MLRQSFDIFNVYGKDDGAFDNMLMAFTQSLSDHLLEDITFAFNEWMQASKIMPTPADIKKLADHYRERRLHPYGAISWFQSIRDRITGEVIEEREHPRDTLCQLDIEKKYQGQNVRVVMVKEIGRA